jgi:hypothetical protein
LEHCIPFWMGEADYGMGLILLSPLPGRIEFQLEAPDGSSIVPASGAGGANAQFVLSRYTADYRCVLPVLPADPAANHAGLACRRKLGPTPGNGRQARPGNRQKPSPAQRPSLRQFPMNSWHTPIRARP